MQTLYQYSIFFGALCADSVSVFHILLCFTCRLRISIPYSSVLYMQSEGGIHRSLVFPRLRPQFSIVAMIMSPGHTHTLTQCCIAYFISQLHSRVNCVPNTFQPSSYPGTGWHWLAQPVPAEWHRQPALGGDPLVWVSLEPSMHSLLLYYFTTFAKKTLQPDLAVR